MNTAPITIRRIVSATAVRVLVCPAIVVAPENTCGRIGVITRIVNGTIFGLSSDTMELSRKLSILADAAKYDASCASSGSKGREGGKKGLGSTTGVGICHSYTPDGRCVSLLKIL